MYDETLPVTGGAALALGGYSMGLPLFLTVAAGLLVLGYGAYRWAGRRNAS